MISSSAQVILTQSDSSSFTTYFIPEEDNLYYTDARVKTKLDLEGVISSSEQYLWVLELYHHPNKLVMPMYITN